MFEIGNMSKIRIKKMHRRKLSPCWEFFKKVSPKFYMKIFCREKTLPIFNALGKIEIAEKLFRK